MMDSVGPLLLGGAPKDISINTTSVTNPTLERTVVATLLGSASINEV